MIFALTLVSILYLFLQRYFNNGIALQTLTVSNLADFFYAAELLVFIISYLIAKPERKKSLILLLSINAGLILTAEILRRSNAFEEQYFLNYPLSKTLIASVYFLIFSFTLFVTLYLLSKILYGRFSTLKTLAIQAIVLTVLLIAGIYLNLSYSDKKDLIERNAKFDYAVVLGAAVNGNKPYPILSGRIRKALELLRGGKAKKILLTGGASPGEESEAKVSYNYLLGKNVPKNKLRFE